VKIRKTQATSTEVSGGWKSISRIMYGYDPNLADQCTISFIPKACDYYKTARD
jgi:hypothetical protein